MTRILPLMNRRVRGGQEMEGKNCGGFTFPCLQYALKCSCGILKVVLISSFNFFFLDLWIDAVLHSAAISLFFSCACFLNTFEVYITISFIIDQTHALRLTDLPRGEIEKMRQNYCWLWSVSFESLECQGATVVVFKV